MEIPEVELKVGSKPLITGYMKYLIGNFTIDRDEYWRMTDEQRQTLHDRHNPGSKALEFDMRFAGKYGRKSGYTCHSGGCPGADMTWEREGETYGVVTIAYSFHNHIHEGKNPKILTVDELAEGWVHVKLADRTLKKNVESIESPYVRNLLCRNWFQVKNSDAVFAIIKGFITRDTVEGGTGWAVQMAIDCDKPVFVCTQHPMDNRWFRYMPIVGFESMRGEIPTLTENFAGIGTRDINRYGIEAIKKVYSTSLTHTKL